MNQTFKSTGHPNVDSFLRELDARISDADKRHSPEGKEMMRRIAPGLKLMAHNEPARFERAMVTVLRKMGWVIEEVSPGQFKVKS